MLNPELHLNPEWRSSKERPIRDGFGDGFLEVARANERVVGLTADLTESTRMEAFAREFPERFFELGVAEQNLVTIASGLAVSGKIPYGASYAAFSPGRTWEQIRTVIAYNNANVKLVGSHAGLSVGPDGATHQALEDIALMRVIPNMSVFSPCDAEEARKAARAVAHLDGPAYLRLAREKSPCITTEKTPFTPGTIEAFWISERPHAAICATGIALSAALAAAADLEADGVRTVVLNISSIKPFDGKAVLSAAKKAGCVVTVEDHQIAGGMGSVIAEWLAQKFPVPVEFVGMRDSFGESGSPKELYEKYGITSAAICDAVMKAIQRKG
jgi:transketolase